MSGYLKNCLIAAREGEEALFHASRNTVTAHLDAYAIIPIEQYDRLILIAEEWVALKLREIARNQD